MNEIKILATGGTIDKVYFDAKSDYAIGEPQAETILQEAGISATYEVVSLLRKDSLELDDADRELIRQTVHADRCRLILITHGTDTMVESALALGDCGDKTVVFVGAMQPARFRVTDAIFNMGFAVGVLRSMAPGVYIAMNGQVFSPDAVRKNRAAARFESV
ncbi:MAG: asparaginase domain-containing protein [Oceanococcus sp.]